MLTAIDLIHELRRLPADTPIGVLTVERAGITTDITANSVADVQPALDDHGHTTVAWLVAIDTSHHPVPPLISVVTDDHDDVAVVPNSVWPFDDTDQ